MIEALLWDMDGVLLDSETLHGQVEDLVFAKFGKVCKEEDKIKYMGTTSDKMWAALREDYDIPATTEELLDMQWETLIEKLPSSGLNASDGLVDVLKYAKSKGIKSAIVSSSRIDFIKAVLDYLNVAEYMDFIVSGFNVKNGKPAPDIYNLALETGHFDAKKCLVIEDSTNGVGSAINAGIPSIGYANPTSIGQDVSKATYIVTNLGQMIDIMEKLV